jgi:DsbC/DsbD-like thiol-disulfide interchange protein
MLRAKTASLAPLYLSATVAAAQDTSTWDTGLHSAARLIAGSADDARIEAGVEVRLDPGWHTYWRDPGDSGVPPTFDFGGSENIKSVNVLWPAPERFPDGAGGYSIGYTQSIIFPLRIVPDDQAHTSTVHLKLSYAACEKLCVPANANLTLKVTSSGKEAAAIAKVEARVPRRVALGAGTGLAIRAVRRDGTGHVVVDVAAPQGAPVDLFAEGPTPEWSLPLPELVGSGAGVRRFAFKLEGLPPGARAEGASLTLTAVSPDDAVEVVAHMD